MQVAVHYSLSRPFTTIDADVETQHSRIFLEHRLACHRQELMTRPHLSAPKVEVVGDVPRRRCCACYDPPAWPPRSDTNDSFRFGARAERPRPRGRRRPSQWRNRSRRACPYLPVLRLLAATNWTCFLTSSERVTAIRTTTARSGS